MSERKLKTKVSSVVIILSMIFLSLLTISFLEPKIIVKAAPSDTYLYARSIVIDKTKVWGSQTNYIVLINLTNNSFKSIANGGKLRADAYDVAFYKEGNVTQFHHDIEFYDAVNGILIAWINITDTITSASNYRFYVFYGDSDATEQANPVATWNGFAAVWHFNRTDTKTKVWDSTGHGVYLTHTNITNSSATVAKWVPSGRGFSFSGHSSYVTQPGDCDKVQVDNKAFTIVQIFKSDGINGQNTTYFHGDFGQSDNKYVRIRFLSNKSVSSTFDNGQSGEYELTSRGNSVDDGGWHTVIFARNSSNVLYFMYDTNNSQTHPPISVAGNASPVIAANTTWYERIATVGATGGSYTINGDRNRYNFTGLMSETWIMKKGFRDKRWVGTLYNNTINPSAFATIGSYEKENKNSVFSLIGTKNGRIAWNGLNSTSVWSNKTGGKGGTLQIYMDLNSTVNVTEIKIRVGNINASGTASPIISASNIAVQLSSDNVTWGDNGHTLNFTDSEYGINISIGPANWTTSHGCFGTSPFVGGEITNKESTIYIHFKLVVPRTGIFYNTQNWHVYLKSN